MESERIDITLSVTDVTGKTTHSVLYPDEEQTVEELREQLAAMFDDWTLIQTLDLRECGSDSRVYFNPAHIVRVELF